MVTSIISLGYRLAAYLNTPPPFGLVKLSSHIIFGKIDLSQRRDKRFYIVIPDHHQSSGDDDDIQSIKNIHPYRLSFIS